MMDVNSMAERGGNEVWFHRPMKSMVAMEFRGRVWWKEACSWTPPCGETADGQKYVRRVLQHKIWSIRK